MKSMPAEPAEGTEVMQTNRENFEAGTSSVEAFWKFVNERHAVWLRRLVKDGPAPWTDDEVIAGGKFTNVFRELDRGTIALRRAEEAFLERSARWESSRRAEIITFNVSWYRMLNRREHIAPGFFERVDPLRRLVMSAEPLFTAAHQTYLPKDAGPGEGVRRWYADNFQRLWDNRKRVAKAVDPDSLERTFKHLQERMKDCGVAGVGPFIAYEIVTDLRRTLLCDAKDAMRWCNINRGGGSARGLRRLGYDETPSGAFKLLNDGINAKLLDPHLAQHLSRGFGSAARNVSPLLELREVEHALCEFDKYERCRTGLGKTRGGAYRQKLEFDDGGFGRSLRTCNLPPNWSGSGDALEPGKGERR